MTDSMRNNLFVYNQRAQQQTPATYLIDHSDMSQHDKETHFTQ